MAQLKVVSINLVNLADIPETVKNTAMSEAVEAIAEALKKGLPKGQGMSAKIDGYKAHTRFGLQSRLQKRGFKVKVQGGKNGIFHIRPAAS